MKTPSRQPDPPVIARTLDLRALAARKSHFVFGPRQTGKTFLVRQALADARLYDLLDSSVFLALSRNPGLIAEEAPSRNAVVVIDEIQRLPDLLNEVHRLIEQRGMRFVMTGSSARKLRRGGVNLLGGRARTVHLHPLTSHELRDCFDLDTALRRGTLPSIYFSDDPAADLDAYAGLYLQQEVVAEGVTRNVQAFSRFLRVAALCNATMVNFTNVANDAQVPRTTVHEYFQILQDTLVLHELPAWRQSRKRRPIASSKYYFFDVGVVGALQGRQAVRPGTREYGEALETWLMHELVSWRDYVSGDRLSYWRSASGFEVDFLIGDHTAVELKASAHVSPQDLRSLRALGEERVFERLLCVSLEPRTRRVGNVTLLPLPRFLEQLWGGAFD
jgi:predicted AAA+ superfamily ATPase